jgi:hypothetical protein
MVTVKTYDHGLWDHGISQGYSVTNIYISGQFPHDRQGGRWRRQYRGTNPANAEKSR